MPATAVFGLFLRCSVAKLHQKLPVLFGFRTEPMRSILLDFKSRIRVKKLSCLRKNTLNLKELEEFKDFEDDVKATFAILKLSTGFSTELYKKLSTF